MPNALHVAEHGDHEDQAVKSHRGGHGFKLHALVSLMSTTAGKTAARVLSSRPDPHDDEHGLQLVHCRYTGSMYKTLMLATEALDPFLLMASKDTESSGVVCTDGSSDSSLSTCTETKLVLEETEKLTGAVSFCGRAGSETVTG